MGNCKDGAIEQTGGQDLLLHAGAATNREGGRIGLAEVASAEPDGTDSGVGAGKPRSDMPGETTQAASPQPGEPLADLADGALNIVGTLDNDGGRIFAGGKIDVELATGLDNSTGHLGVRQLDIGGGDLHNRGGELKVADKVRIQAGQLNNDAGSMQLAGLLTLHAENLSNRSGILAHSGTDDTRLHVKETLDNHEGTLASNAGRLIIQGKALVNIDGQLRHAGEKGLVVRVDKFSGAAGHMATAGAAELKLGEVDHRRAKLSATQVEIDAASFDNRGGEIVATAAGSNRMNVAGTLDNGQTGRIASNGELTIHAATLGNAGGTVQQANDGRLTIVADTLSGAGGTIVGNGALAVTGKYTDLSYGTTYAKNIKIETDHLSTAGGKLSASGTDTLDLKVAGTFDNTRGDVTAAADIFLRAGELQNNAGAIVTAGRSSLQLNVDGRIDNNDDGTLAAGGDMSLRANALSNRKGSIQHAGDGTLSIRAVSLDGTDGSIVSNAALQLHGGDIDLSGATTQASKIGIDAGSLSTVGGKLTALSDSVLDLVVRGAVDNAGGTAASNGMLALRAKSLSNLGGKFSMAGVEVSKITVADTLDNSARGTLAAAGDLMLQAGVLDNREGAIRHAGKGVLLLSAPNIRGAGGSIASDGTLTVSAETFDLAGAKTVAQRIAVDTGELSMAGGMLNAIGAEALRLHARDNVDNSGGAVVSHGAVDLQAKSLKNQGGKITGFGAGASQIAVADTLDNSVGGSLESGGDFTLRAGKLDNRKGKIQHAGSGLVKITAAELQGAAGVIGSNGTLALTGTDTDLSDANTFAKRIDIKTDRLSTARSTLSATGPEQLLMHARKILDNTGGTIAGNGSLDLSAESLVNRDGKITGAGGEASQIAVAGQFDNTRGNLTATGNTTIKLAALLNQGGVVGAGNGSLQITAAQTLDNSKEGTLSAGGDLKLNALTLDNRKGRVRHAGRGAASITASELQGAGGTIASNGALTLTAGTMDLSNANTFAPRIAIDAGKLINAGGMLSASSADPLTVRVREAIDNTGGTIVGNGGLDLHAASFSNQDGKIHAAGTTDTRVTVANTLDNTKGAVAAGGSVAVSAGNLLNQGGKVQAAGAAGLDVKVNGALDNRSSGMIVSGGKGGIAAASLDNRGGTLNGHGALNVSIVDGLDNRAGKVVSNGDLGLTAGSLDNREGGQLASIKGNAGVASRGKINNAGGGLQAARDLNVESTALGNGAGSLLGANVRIDTRRGALNNVDGTVASTAGRLDVLSGALDNTRGLVQSAGAMLVNTHGQELLNTDSGAKGGVLSGGALELASGSVDNRAGVMYSQGDLTAHTGSVDNTGDGQLGGKTTVRLTAGALHNRGGKLQAGQDLNVDVGSGTAENSAGLMVAGNGLTLTAGAVVNRDTRGAAADAPLGLQGGTVSVTANRMDNTAGAIAADRHIGFTGSGVDSVLDNTRGSVSSAGSGAVVTNRVINSAGTLLSGVQQSIAADSMTGDGNVLSNGDLTVDLQQDFANGGEITANGRVLIRTLGRVSNDGMLRAGHLEVRGGNVDNAVSGEISGGRTVVVADQAVNNRGLIDGRDTLVQAGTFDNVGTGRVYGDHVSIQAGTVNNREEHAHGTTKAAVIAARQRLDIGAQSINNREQGLIFSAGSGEDALNIGGSLDAASRAVGRASQVQNDSATIASLGGITLDASHLLNRNLHFATEVVPVSGPTQVKLVQPKGDPRKYDINELERGHLKGTYLYRHKQTRAEYRSWHEFDVTRSELETKVTQSVPALIRAGGNITLRGDSLVNDKSQIFHGGMLHGDLSKLKNEDAWGQRTVREHGVVMFTWENWRGGSKRRHERKETDRVIYSPADEVHSIPLNVGRVERRAGSGGIGYTIGDRRNPGVGAVIESRAGGGGAGSGAVPRHIVEVKAAPGAMANFGVGRVHGVAEGNGADAAIGASVVASRGAHVAQVAGVDSTDGPVVAVKTGPNVDAGRLVSGVDANAPAVIRTVGVDSRIPNNSLFRVQPDSGSYLIETDPRFANYRDWLSSAYLLERMGDDPTRMQKRLGDGFYEQSLVRDQIGLLTGRRFLRSYQ